MVLLVVAGSAEAGRKRVVILDFDGPKAEKFHDDLVKLVKKNSFTVVPTDKWNGTAEELEATAPDSSKDIKKVAKKLKVDAVISGKIEKRRDEYLIHLKLRAGASGDVAKPVDTKSSSAHIDSKASSDIKDELLDAIESLDGAKAGGGDDGDDEPKTTKKKTVKKDDDGDDEPTKTTKKKPAKDDAKKKDDDSGDGDGDDAPKHKGFSKSNTDDMKGSDKVNKKKPAKKDDDDSDDGAVASKKDEAKKAKKDDDSGDDKPVASKKRPAKSDKKKDDDDAGDGGDGDDGDGGGKKKKVAKKDDDGGEVEGGAEPAGPVDADFALSPGGRAIDVTVGLSFIARRMSFKSDPTIDNPPPGYKGVPAPGAVIDAVVYPQAIGHKNSGILTNLGVAFTYDRVLHVSSKATYLDDTGATQTATLQTEAQRYSVGAAFRYPLGMTANSPVVGAQLRYGQQAFLIAQEIPGTTMSSDIPNVTYTYIEPSLQVHYPVTAQIVLNLNAGVQVVTGTGDIGTAQQYGAASVLGFEGDAGLDYMINKNLFARAAFHADTIGLNFKGTGAETMRGGATPVVSGARDTYIGGVATVGYIY